MCVINISAAGLFDRVDPHEVCPYNKAFATQANGHSHLFLFSGQLSLVWKEGFAGLAGGVPLTVCQASPSGSV